jgi:hypothetical protein
MIWKFCLKENRIGVDAEFYLLKPEKVTMTLKSISIIIVILHIFRFDVIF